MSFLRRGIYVLMIILMISAMTSCRSDRENNESTGNEFIRYEQLLFNLDTNVIENQFKDLQSTYPNFTDLYFGKIMGFPSYLDTDSIFFVELKHFITDTVNLRILELVNKEFANFRAIERKFNSTVQNMQNEFPGIQKPRFYTFISMFAYQGLIFDDQESDGLAIGLDMFLGDRFPYESIIDNQNVFAVYLNRTYNSDHMHKKIVQLWLEDKFFNNTGARAIDHIIDNGKKYYLMKKLIPELADTVMFEYTPSQLKWMENNEQEMWSFLIKNNLFYTTDEYKIIRLVNPSPNSQALGMPVNSPGLTGNYIGYRIIQSYMNRNRETSISDLISNRDAQNILEASRFKPKVR